MKQTDDDCCLLFTISTDLLTTPSLVHADVQFYTVSAGLLQSCVALNSGRYSIQELQRVQNTGTRIVIQANGQLLLEHWLSVHQRIDYKLAVYIQDTLERPLSTFYSS